MMVLDVVTQNLCYRRVENIFARRHMVYSATRKDFVPLAHNAVVSPIDHYLLIGGCPADEQINRISSFQHPVKNYLLVTDNDEIIIVGSKQCRAIGLAGFGRISDRIGLTWIENEPMSIINCLDI